LSRPANISALPVVRAGFRSSAVENRTPSAFSLSQRLITTAGQNRNDHRDATMVLIAYRHGLRASELVSLRARHDHGLFSAAGMKIFVAS
jgi:site-specific recombinase XerC